MLSKFCILIKRVFELFTHKVCDMFVYKLAETIQYIEKKPTFQEKYKLYGSITQEFFGLRMQNFQGFIFVWIRTNREIFKSSLKYH